jgi:biopolymer transport protein ExbB
MLDSVSAIVAHPTQVALILLSMLALAIGAERWSFAWRNHRRLRSSRSSILGHLQAGKRTMAQAVNSTSPSHAATPLFELLLEAGHAETRIRRTYSQVIRRARARLWILGSIASIAPFVGLLGTVLGVMRAFEDIASRGAGGFEVVSAGISEALITTAVGIFVGIEAVLLFNALKVRVSDYAAELREAVEEIGEAQAGVPDALGS